MSDVILQFRSLRMLVLEDQLDRVGREVRNADHPAVIADPQGRILLINDRFDRLLGAGHPPLQWLDDLPQLFGDPGRVVEHLSQLVDRWSAVRAEVHIGPPDDRTPLLLRADPVLAAQDRVLGFVLLFTLLDERKAAEAARRRFQEEIVEDGAFTRTQHGGEPDLRIRGLAGAVLDNAHLAAMEITDGVDLGRVPDMLEGVQSSVRRSTELLDHLSRYGAGGRSEPGD